MKSCLLTVALFCAFFCAAQVSVTVNPAVPIKTLSGKENGINLNYLTDDAYASSSTATSAALKKMGVKFLRYPGGEKSDNYFFSGYPWNTSAPRMASRDMRGWPTCDDRFVETASLEKMCKSSVLDFDEMIKMAHEIEAEPLIVVAYDIMYLDFGSGAPAVKPTKKELIEHAVEWVRYANIKKRYNVKYWMIGNESWNNPDYNGRTTPTQYAADLYEFATAMKAVDPTIKIVANGEKSWWPTLLKSTAVSLIDILAFSSYPTWDYKGGYEYYKNNNVSLTGELDAALAAINSYAPAKHRVRLKVLPSEYNSIDWSGNWSNENNLGHALCNFQMFGDMLLQPKLEAVCMWNTRWVDTDGQPQSVYNAINKAGDLNANGKAIEVWGKNLLHKMVETYSNDNMIKSYASYDTINQSLNIFILNKDITGKKVKLDIKNYVSNFGGSKWSFEGQSPDDLSPELKWIDGITSPSQIATVEVAPTSVTVIKLFTTLVLLPVKITLFEGEARQSQLQLKWAVTDEKEVSSYVVEKQQEGGRFQAIGAVTSGGGAKGTYTFNDLKPDAYNTYRLKIIYANGSIEYSRLIRIAMPEHSSSLKASLILNPVRSSLKLQIQLPSNQTIDIKVVDQLGRTWINKKHTTVHKNEFIQIEESQQLPQGTYWMQLSLPEQAQTIQFLKL